MNTEAAVETLVKAVPDPTQGLPDGVFYYISRTTPLVNVDLLIQDEAGRTLLAWRNDRYAGAGWHVPGGIVRFKETLETRVRKVADNEIGAPVECAPQPIAIHQFIHRSRDIRGHFISLLYRCFLSGSFEPPNTGRGDGDAGYLKWHARCPDDILPIHHVYTSYMDGSAGEGTDG
jgi:ADP-ribose pyrophosphatase YjhB (NUDIX family)